MNRVAILIGSGNSKYGYLPGVAADLRRYSDFLQSAYGGAWYEAEIEVLRDPTRDQVSNTLYQRTLGADFTFVAFSGHGGHDMQGGTSIAINDDDEIQVSSLVSRARRQLVIVDACRTLTSLEEGRTIKLGAVRKAAPSLDYILSCRQAYDNEVMAAEEGRSIMYSCSVNQSAGESSKGGHFSRALIEYCADWGEAGSAYTTTPTQRLDVPAAFGPVAAFVAQQYFPQQPELENGRRRRSFPLAIR